MTFILLCGEDGTGKSVQAKSIAEYSEGSLHLSFAVKNRKLYKNSTVESIECLRFNSDSSINPYTTIDTFHSMVGKIIKENIPRLVVIDEITYMRTWAQPCAIEWFNRTYAKDRKISKIGQENMLAWEYVNKITYGELERLVTWAEISDCNLIAITNLIDVRELELGDDGKKHSLATGAKVVNAKDNLRKLSDVRVRFEKDGKHGKGYYAIYEKTQDWMGGGEDAVKVDKTGLLTEFLTRGVVE